MSRRWLPVVLPSFPACKPAVLAKLVAEVLTIEIVESLAGGTGAEW